MKIGFIGFGEAAYEMACGLKQEGLTDIYAYDVMQNNGVFGPQIKERIDKSQVIQLDSYKEVIDKAGTVLIAVPADHAYEVSQSLKPILKTDMLYADLTASTPDNKQRIWQNLKETGIRFVDVAMLGALVVHKHKVPILVSGCGAQRFCDEMIPFGMNITVTSDTPGAASAVKLVRSIYMKGTASLLFEMLEAACHFGVDEQVIASLSDTMDSKSFAETMNRLVTGTSIHAHRRGVELSGSVNMLKNAGINSEMSAAAVQKHQNLAALDFKTKMQGRVPKDWREVISLVTKERKG